MYFSSISFLADPCLRYDCYGGTCMNDRGSPRCICPTGRVGSRCQGTNGHWSLFLFLSIFCSIDLR